MKFLKLYLVAVFAISSNACKKDNQNPELNTGAHLTEIEYADTIMTNPEIKTLVYVSVSGGTINNFRIVRTNSSTPPQKLRNLVEIVESKGLSDGDWYLAYGLMNSDSSEERRFPIILQTETARVVTSTNP